MRESAGGPMARAEERPYGQAPTGGQARDMKQWEIRSAIAAAAMMTPAIPAHVGALNGETVSFDMRLADRAFHGRVSPLKDGEGEQIGTICAVIEDTSAGLPVLEPP